jgi:CRP-like cAMP-binding protein
VPARNVPPRRLEQLLIGARGQSGAAFAVGHPRPSFGLLAHLATTFVIPSSAPASYVATRAAICDISHTGARESLMHPADMPFLRQLGREDSEALLSQMRRRRLARGQPIIHAGAAGDDVVVVLDGRVKLVAYGVDRREVVLGLRGPGELIGEMAALGGQRRTASAVAVDDVEVAYFSAEELRRFVAGHPGVALVLIRMLVRRLSEADRDRIDLATQDSVGRVAKRLVELAEDHGTPDGDGTRIELSLTQDELASWTGATRETVSRALALMRRLGWIATDHRAIIVLDPDALRDRSGTTVAR